MNKNLLFSVVAIVIAITVVFSCILIFTRNKPSTEADEKINELYSQKNRLDYEINKYQRELETLTVTKAGIFVFFENLEDALIDNALPLLQEYGEYKAIVNISPEEYRSSVLFDEIEKQGWEVAIKFDSNYSFPENNEEACNALEEHLKLYGEKGDIPSIISFSSGNASYRRAFDEILSEYEIKVVVAPRTLLSGGNEFLDYDHENGLLKISCVPFSVTNAVEAIMRSHITSNKPLALSIKHLEAEVPANSDKLSTKKFTLMLEYIKLQNDLFVGNCLSYREFIVSEHSKNIDDYNAIIKKIEECEDKIASIDAEIKALLDTRS